MNSSKMNCSGNKANTIDFKSNDLVFGKIKGHPYWLAKLIKVDSETFKIVIKYEVQFFATNEVSKLNKSDLCFYFENKLKYTLDVVASKHKDIYKKALSEIGEAWGLRNKIASPSKSKVGVKSPSNKLDTGDYLLAQPLQPFTHKPSKDTETLLLKQFNRD